MIHSAEARWFFRGDTDPYVESWFKSAEPSSDHPERTDAYIVLPGCRSVGVKFREGNFEVKAATSASRDFVLGGTMAGRRETWVKWSRPSGVAAEAAVATREDELWAFVRKRRVLRLFSLESGSVEAAAHGGPWLAAGCQVERTLVSVILRSSPDGPPRESDWGDSEPWWTFGFEAFGQPVALEGHLDRMLEYFASAAAGISLPRDASMSYPAWLAKLAGDT